MQETFFVKDISKAPNSIGVYLISFLNSTSGKVYIGSAACVKNNKSKHGFKGRWQGHLCSLRKNRNSCKKLQAAFNKYGEKKMFFTVLEVCDSKECLIKEQLYIDSFNACLEGYNSRANASSNLGFKHSEKSKEKMIESAKNKRESLKPFVYDLYKKGATIDQVAAQLNISRSLIGKLLKESGEFKDKKSMAKYIGRPIFQYNSKGDLLNQYDSIMSCSYATKISESEIRRSAAQNIFGRRPKFIFSFKILTLDEILDLLLFFNKYKIARFDVAGNLIDIWEDQLEFFEKNNLKPCSQLSEVLNGKRRTFLGFCWKKYPF